MIKKIFKTQDGSPSFIIDELDETYHSRYGALTEASYIYIEKGLSSWIKNNNKKEVSIFEMGLGTGLNAYLAFCFCNKNNIKLNYYTVEKFPLSMEEIKLLGMEKYLPYPEFHKLFRWLHSSDWNTNNFHEDFFLKKSNSDFFDSTINKKCDIIFYDAFGYNAQPEMWGKKALEICSRALKPCGYWISYCSKGSVRRCLEKLGFSVDRLQGPPGKREILRAIKTV